MTTGEDGQQQYVIYRLDNRIPAHVANIKDDYDIFESVAREKANQEEVEKWMRKKLASTFVQINDDYKDCVFEFPWVTSK
jgi:peptidyl-prolyl cis-trans isomerase SurA